MQILVSHQQNTKKNEKKKKEFVSTLFNSKSKCESSLYEAL